MGLWQLSRNKRGADVLAYFFKDVEFDPRDAGWLDLMALAVSERGCAMSTGSCRRCSRRRSCGESAPTLLLIGEKEVIYEPHATLKRARDRMRRLEGDIVANAHHIAAMAQPDEINARIRQFLQWSV